LAPKPRKVSPRKAQPDSRALAIAALERWRTIRAIGQILAGGVVMLCIWPVAHEIAGKDTRVNISITIGISLALTLTNAGTALWGNNHRKRANSLDARNNRLAAKLRELGESPEQIAAGTAS
jgi:hypothetical protein